MQQPDQSRTRETLSRAPGRSSLALMWHRMFNASVRMRSKRRKVALRAPTTTRWLRRSLSANGDCVDRGLDVLTRCIQRSDNLRRVRGTTLDQRLHIVDLFLRRGERICLKLCDGLFNCRVHDAYLEKSLVPKDQLKNVLVVHERTIQMPLYLDIPSVGRVRLRWQDWGRRRPQEIPRPHWRLSTRVRRM